MSDTRGREHRIEIHAPLEEVWRALTEADEIVRWFAPEAEVEAREGGRYWVSWGEGMAATSRIETIEPPRRLRLVHESEGFSELDPPVVEEYLLESRGDVTVLRLVQSGIPASADWDDFYEDTGRGWKMFFVGLRHYLERHPGRPRENIIFMQPVRVPADEAWRILTGAGGLVSEAPLDGSYVGQRLTLAPEPDRELQAKVLLCEPPHTLTMTVADLEDSFLALDLERIDGKTFLYFNLSMFRVPEAERHDLRVRFKTWLDRLFPDSKGEST